MEQKLFSDHVVEVRYEPTGAFLNLRGVIADFVKTEGLFRHWRITENRVDFWNSDDSDTDPETAFVSFRNCGYKVHNPATRNYVTDRAAKFLAKLENQRDYEYPPVMRLGVRARFYQSIDNLDWEQLRDLFATKVFSSSFVGLFGGTTDDVGAILNFQQGNMHIHTNSGPMKKEQFVTQFSPLSKEEAMAAMGLFLDIDVFMEDLGKLPTKRLILDVKDLHQRCWQNLDSFIHSFGL